MVSKRPFLLHPVIDFLMVGGLSFISLAFCFLFSWDRPEILSQIGWCFFIAGFLVNFPHFAASYQIFYGDHRKKMFSRWNWTFIGFVLPILIIIYGIVCYTTLSIQGMTLLVHTMFFFVGWHYVKQIFGCVIVLAKKSDYFFT